LTSNLGLTIHGISIAEKQKHAAEQTVSRIAGQGHKLRRGRNAPWRHNTLTAVFNYRHDLV